MLMGIDEKIKIFRKGNDIHVQMINDKILAVRLPLMSPHSIPRNYGREPMIILKREVVVEESRGRKSRLYFERG